ncbi:MAG: ABC transporter substrate-binding protein [Clostridia bacterium]|nr:ABC transporter substrate-binding protein [Clostridia bacterium]
MKKTIVIILATLVCAGLLIYSGCGSNSDEIVFLLDWTPNTNHTGVYVALEMGYYEEEGLSVSVQQPGDTGTSMLVSAGLAQLGVDFQDQMAYNYEKDINVTAVAAVIQHNTSGIVSLKSQGITSPSKMMDKTYASWELDIEKAIIKEIMENDGGDFSKLKFVPNTVYDVASALQTDVDCVWVFEGWDKLNVELQGVNINYFSFKDFADELDYYTPVIIANNDYLRDNPEQAKAFLRATEKGYRYAIENPEEAARILCKHVPELDERLIKASQIWLADQYIADAQRWGVIEGERWDAFFAWLYEKGILTERTPDGYGFSNDFLTDSSK